MVIRYREQNWRYLTSVPTFLLIILVQNFMRNNALYLPNVDLVHPTHNKELNEESDSCINKLSSCFDSSCYKKFAGKTAWILTFSISWLGRNLIGTCFGQYYIQ